MESHVPEIYMACLTTHYMKGVLSFNRLAFKHVPMDVNTSKACEDSIFVKSVRHSFYKIFVLIRRRNQRFQLRCGCFSPHGNF